MSRGLLLGTGLCLVALAQPASPTGRAAEPPTHVVAPTPFLVEARLEGVFESTVMAEVSIDAKRWTQLVVDEAVPHGTRVKAGDVLVRLDTTKLDETVRDLEIAGRLADLGHGLLERELAMLEKATPLQLELALRNRRMVAEDLARYETQEAALAAADNDMALQAARFRSESAEEELEQLEKMYMQDELTEETEEIVLKRARFGVDIARFNARFMEDRHDRFAALELPRRLESMRRTALLSELDLERAQTALPVAVDRMRLELEKSTHERRKAAENLADLEADRTLMTILAPVDGVVYYGRWQQGKWIDSEQAAGRLRPGGKLDPRTVFLTVVDGSKLIVRAGVPEKDLAHVEPGREAVIVPRSFPDRRLRGAVTAISDVPVAAGRFEAVIEPQGVGPPLVAGMGAETRVVVARLPDAIAVPKKAVFADELDDSQRYVYVAAAAGKPPQRRPVAVGRANDTLVEVTAGLAQGDVILLEKPSPPPPPPSTTAEPKSAAANQPAAISDGSDEANRKQAP
jgi:HlyD family secretion protein